MWRSCHYFYFFFWLLGFSFVCWVFLICWVGWSGSLWCMKASNNCHFQSPKCPRLDIWERRNTQIHLYIWECCHFPSRFLDPFEYSFPSPCDLDDLGCWESSAFYFGRGRLVNWSAIFDFLFFGICLNLPSSSFCWKVCFFGGRIDLGYCKIYKFCAFGRYFAGCAYSFA